jgi:sulfite exporter TauE/SafE
MAKKQTGAQFAKEQKQARTVRVVTLVKAAIIVVALGVAFIGGWQARSQDNARVQGQAHEMLEALTVKR